MNAAQIALYAECRVAMPSGMIRLRSITDDQGRFGVRATRPPFRSVAPAQHPRVVLPPVELSEVSLRPVEDFPSMSAWVALHSSVAWERPAVVAGYCREAARTLTRTILRDWPKPTADVAGL